jgi:hypothetical protein
MMKHMQERRTVSSDRPLLPDGSETAPTTTMRLPGTSKPQGTTQDAMQKRFGYGMHTQPRGGVKTHMHTDPCVKKSGCCFSCRWVRLEIIAAGPAACTDNGKRWDVGEGETRCLGRRLKHVKECFFPTLTSVDERIEIGLRGVLLQGCVGKGRSRARQRPHSSPRSVGRLSF